MYVYLFQKYQAIYFHAGQLPSAAHGSVLACFQSKLQIHQSDWFYQQKEISSHFLCFL